jgi:hypothetical protein
MKSKKLTLTTVLSGALLISASFSSQASLAQLLVGNTVNNTVDAAKEVMLKRKTKIKMTSSTIESKCKLKYAVVVGTCGIEISAAEVEINDVDIKSEVDITAGGVYGTAGIKVGQ